MIYVGYNNMEGVMDYRFRSYDKDCEFFVYTHKGYDENGEAYFDFTDGTLKAFAVRDNGIMYPPKERAYSEELEPVEISTGLKDRNGVEIFEGDIIKFRTPHGDGMGEVWWDAYAAGFKHRWVEIENGKPTGYQRPSKIFWDNGEVEPTIEVIGNVHQNSELIGG